MSGAVRVSHYGELLAVVRARIDELEVAHSTIEHITGLGDGHVGKLVCDQAAFEHRTMQPFTMFVLLHALGLEISVAPDPEGLEKVRSRLKKRRKTKIRARARTLTFTPDALRQNAVKGGFARAQKLTPQQRSRAARKAVLVRWADVKEAAKVEKR